MNPETTAIFPKLSPLEGHLWARSGKNVGRRYSVGKIEQVLGRSPACDIEVEDDRVSLQHAKIVSVEGRHHIYDLGSTNGTFVNDQRVDEAELRDGDIIQIGETIYEYLCNEERALTITLRGSADSVVPSALREGAKQMLQRERHTSGDFTPPRTPPNGTPADDRARPNINLSLPSIPQPQKQGSTPSSLPVPGMPLVPGVQAMPGMPAMPGMQGMPNMPVPYGQFPPGQPMMPPAYPQQVVLSDDDEDEGGGDISLAEILAIARKIMGMFIPYWKSVAIATVLGMGLGVASLKFMPAARKAFFQMNVHTNQAENPVTDFRLSNLQFFRAAEQNFVSPVVIKRTLTALGESDLSDDNVKAYQESLDIAKMGGGIPGHPMNVNSNTYEGSYKDKKPDAALRYLDKHLRTYLEAEVEKSLNVVQVEVDFLAKHVAEAQEDLNRREWELTEFKRKNIEALPEQARTMYSLAFSLAQKQRDLSEEAARYANALEHTNRKVLFTPEFEEGQIAQVKPYAIPIAQKRQELAAEQAAGKGPQHPDVIKTLGELQQLEELERDVESRNEQQSIRNVNQSHRNAQDSKYELEKSESVTRQYASQVQRDLDEVRKKIADLPEQEAMYASLQREFDSAKETYQKLAAQERAAKLQLELERAAATARYDIITPPQLEVVSQLRDLLKRLAIGGIAFFFLAFMRVAFILLRAHIRTLTVPAENKNETALVGPETPQPPAAI